MYVYFATFRLFCISPIYTLDAAAAAEAAAAAAAAAAASAANTSIKDLHRRRGALIGLMDVFAAAAAFLFPPALIEFAAVQQQFAVIDSSRGLQQIADCLGKPSHLMQQAIVFCNTLSACR